MRLEGKNGKAIPDDGTYRVFEAAPAAQAEREWLTKSHLRRR